MEMQFAGTRLLGVSLIGQERAARSGQGFYGVNASTGERLDPLYYSASSEELERAVSLAARAFPVYREVERNRKAGFLREVAANIEALGDALIGRVMAESALPESARARRARSHLLPTSLLRRHSGGRLMGRRPHRYRGS